MHWTDDPDHPLRKRFDNEFWDEARCARELAENLGHGHRDSLELTMHAMNELHCWRPCIGQFAKRSSDETLGKALLTFWLVYGHHTIPLGLKSDLPVFVDALRRHLPPYQGSSVTLYRGDLDSRYLEGNLGIAWTTDLVYAGIFARNREYEDVNGQMLEGRGVVLRIEASGPMIVVDSPTYGAYLKKGEHEYIVDPQLIGAVTTIPYSKIPDELRY